MIFPQSVVNAHPIWEAHGFGGGLRMTEALEQSVSTNDAAATTAVPDSSLTSRWAFINGWQVAPQSNDRALATGASNPNSNVSPAARRSSVRRQLQISYKEWSKRRTD